MDHIRIFKKKLLSKFALLLIPLLIFFISETFLGLKFKDEFGKLGYSIKQFKMKHRNSPYTVYESTPNRVEFLNESWFNNYGFRNKKNITKKNSNIFRIFILGGSAAYGTGSVSTFAKLTGYPKYPSKYTIAYRLEKNLSEIFPHKKIEVFNAAVEGFTIQQEYNLYMSTIRKLEPDLLILIDGHNDIMFPLSDNYFFQPDADRYNWEKLKPRRLKAKIGFYLVSRSYSFGYILRLLGLGRMQKVDQDCFNKYAAMDISTNKKDIQTVFTLHEQNIKRNVDNIIDRYKIFKQTCFIDDVNILFCPQPLLTLKKNKSKTEKACLNLLLTLKSDPTSILPYYHLYEYYIEQFTKWAKEDSVSYIDLQKEINQVSKQVFVDPCHFSPQGNNLIASILTEKIKSMKIIK